MNCLLSLRTLTLLFFFLLLFAIYFYFTRNHFKLVVKKSEIWLMRKRRLFKAGVILPLNSPSQLEQLENVIKMRGLEASLELAISKEKERRLIYLYCSSTTLLHSLGFTQVEPNTDLSEMFFSILGDKTFKKASLIGRENVLRLENAGSPFFLSVMTFSSISSQRISELLEELRKASKKFDIIIHLILPMKPISNSTSKLSKTREDAASGSFNVKLSPYVVLLSRSLSSLSEAVEEIKAFMYPIYRVSLMKSRMVLKNLLKITCRFYVSSSPPLLGDIDMLRDFLEHICVPEPPPSISHSVTLGKLLIKNHVLDFKIDENLLNPALLLVRQPSSLALLIKNLAFHLPYKWLILDFQGITFQLRDAMGGLALSEKNGFTSISLVPSSNMPLHEYLARLVNLLAKVLNFPATESSMIRELIRTTSHERIVSFLLEATRIMSDETCQEERTKEFLSDIKRGVLTEFFEENHPTLVELFPAPKIFLDLSKQSSRLTLTTLEFLTSIIIDLCPKNEYAILVIASPSIIINLLECGITDNASKTPILLFSTFNFNASSLTPHHSQRFKSIIMETESIKQDDRTFSFLRSDCPPLIFHLQLQGDTSTQGDTSINSSYPVSELEAKVLHLLENSTYVTEKLISQASGASKEDVWETLRRVRKTKPHVNCAYLPMPGGKRLPVFFLETRGINEVVSSYAYDLIEKICSETGLLLVQFRDPKLGLDGFINGHPFKLALTKTEKEIKKLSQQLEKAVEKHGVVIVVFLDERDAKLALELEKLFGSKVITTHLGVLDQLPLKLEARQLSSSLTKVTLTRKA